MDFAFPSPGIFPHYVPQHEQRGFPDIVTLSLVGELSAGNKTKSPYLHCTARLLLYTLYWRITIASKVDPGWGWEGGRRDDLLRAYTSPIEPAV